MPDSESERESKEARAEGVKRMLTDQPPPTEPPEQNPEPAREVGGASSVGESVTRRGEDVVKEEGKESGRYDTGTDDTPAQRPTGESTTRDATGVDPQ